MGTETLAAEGQGVSMKRARSSYDESSDVQNDVSSTCLQRDSYSERNLSQWHVPD